MLTKVIVENFRSFKNKTVFDLSSTKYQILSNSNVNNNVLKGALIVGPNATGKSTLLIAIKTLLDMLFADNFTIDVSDSCLFCQKNNIHLEYHFKFDDDEVIYLFISDKNGEIIDETLTINNKLILERKSLDGIIYQDNSKKQINNTLFSEKGLLLKKCYFSDIFAGDKTIKTFMEYLRNSIYVNAYHKKATSYNNVSHIIEYIENEDFSHINKVFKDLNIGFSISREKEQRISNFVDEKGNRMGYAIKGDKPIIFFKRNDMELNLPLSFESLGNQTLVNIMPSLIYACEHDCLIIIDEFSSSLHNDLEEVLIKYLLTKSDKSQVIFTSHSTNLLTTKLLRPDQIYTIIFKPNEGSFISRFSDENPREAQNLEKMYLSGKFGALPNYKL